MQYKNDLKDLEKQLPVLKKAQIVLYGILGLFDKSVKMSLACQDIDLAKVYAKARP